MSKTENICGRALWMVPKSLPKLQIESTIQQRSYARTLKKILVSEISNTIRVGFGKLPLVCIYSGNIEEVFDVHLKLKAPSKSQ